METNQQRAARLYKKGQTYAQIAVSFGVAIGTVWRWVRAEGVASRPRGPKPSGMRRAR
ncbi:MAG: helix-turn-helix domain-containing protein [Candidatus Eisenbacteria bacterium]|uniref:Helix-turn-helix domain-containing protein n=1 Tax=Eiseniibacteriota bacterium TaxID=2212470 RepID=A0A956LUR3_UNCEI|nr:helix-turn-helix domain-containing protein [Candidatus Eisenbacteria bacterium]